MWEPVHKVETRVTLLGREPWELALLVAVLLVVNLTSREWAGPLGSVAVTLVVTALVNLGLKRLKQAIPTQAFVQYGLWLASHDVYLVGREAVCKPLVLTRAERPLGPRPAAAGAP